MTDIDIKWNGSLETDKLINELCHESMKPQFHSHKKAMGPIIEELVISFQDHSWMILKTQTEIKKFIQDYNSKFNASLSFGEFMIKGVREVAQNKKVQDWKPFQNFIQFQDISLNKIKSIKMLKKCGGRHRQKYLCCNMNWMIWKQRNFVITPEGVMYHKTETQVKEYIPFDKSFQARNGEDVPNQENLDIMLVSNHRNLLVRAKDHYNYLQFMYFLKQGCKAAAKNFHHRFDSFAPERKLNYVEFKIDGQQYFKQVAKALQQAKSQIFIAGWWVSPEFYLVRPCIGENRKHRLDRSLKAAAERGIKIYILVYYQSSFLTNDSQYTKSALQALHTNIKVIRHPLTVLPTFWSHHQKAVIIDQSLAFMGGLDLCYGRFDNQKHLIDHNSEDHYPGIQYNNSRMRDLTQVRNIHQQSIFRHEPRLPWHDVAMVLRGESVKDVCKHFIEYWNFANFQTHYQDRKVLHLKTKKIDINAIQRKFNAGLQKIKQFAQDLRGIIIRDGESQNSQSQNAKKELTMKKQSLDTDKGFKALNKKPLFVTVKDSSTIMKQQNLASRKQLAIQETIMEQNPNETNIQKQILAKHEPRLSLRQIDNNEIVINAREYFRQQQEAQKAKKGQQREDNFTKILRRVSKPDQQDLKNIKPQRQNLSIIYEKVPLKQQQNFINIKQQVSNFSRRNSIGASHKHLTLPQECQQQEVAQRCQIVRSASHWSIGCKVGTKQMSIQVAYIKMIQQAKHFIYIQNQFFISSVDDSKQIKNQVVEALYQRIRQAIQKKQKFKVFVLMPLIPGFAGQLDDSAAVVPRLVMHWQYKTICRHPNSLLQRLSNIAEDPSQYINFYGLRNHGVIQNVPMTQIVYLHSKLMIVDDSRLILGSANINDRSMQGSRDSQLCCIVEGGKAIQIKRNGLKTKVSKNIHCLRLKLWSQHFGLKSSQSVDPLSEQTCNKISRLAKKNTIIYRQLFGCYPDDNIHSLTNLHSLKKKPSKIEYQKNKDYIQGFAVQFPMHFLQLQDLTIGSTLYPNNVST